MFAEIPTFVAEMLVVGSWAFWLAVIVYVVSLFALVENDVGWGASILTIGLLAAFQWLFHVDVFGAIANHPYLAVLAFMGYFACGATWSAWKWYLYAMSRVQTYFNLKRQYMEDMGVEDPKNVPSEMEEKWVKYLKEDYPAGKNAAALTRTPLVREHKSDITRWIAYWPISLSWWALHDIVKGIATAVYNYIGGILQSIADKVYEKIKKDLPDGFKRA